MSFSELTGIIGLVLLLSFVFGCTIGSFLNVVVWRVPRGESLVSPPSHCPNCGHLIRAWENIPVLSWVFLRGRCSGCHLPISIRYPLGELATGFGYLLVAYMAWRRNLPVGVLPGYFFAFGVMISVAQIDMKHGIIPDSVNLTGIVVSGLLALLVPSGRLGLMSSGGGSRHGCMLVSQVFEGLAAAGMEGLPEASPLLSAGIDWLFGCLLGLVLLGCVSYPFWVWGRLAKGDVVLPVGWGDVKYLCMLGGFFGGDACLYILCWAASLGFVYGVGRKLVLRGKDGWSVCFGPCLSLGGFAWMLFGCDWMCGQ